MSLRDEIYDADRTLYRMLRQVEDQRKFILDLKAQRVDCNHVWEDALPGFEHEGGVCMKCGINELEAVSKPFG